ncbi:MAG: hypothetical protein HC786_20515 [Richelia sp. CSU_2_1]|nr:hypothetical protein [Richelia sp. CSU_2_1]
MLAIPADTEDLNLKSEAVKKLSVLLRYLRQSKSVTLEEKRDLRQKLPSIPDESQLEDLTLEAFTKKLISILARSEALSPGTLQRWEGGKTMPEALNLLRIAKLAGVKIQELYVFQKLYVRVGEHNASRVSSVSDRERYRPVIVHSPLVPRRKSGIHTSKLIWNSIRKADINN